MRAVRLVDGVPRLHERPDPEPAEGEAVVRVRVAGLCGTDLEIARGYLGFEGTPGHEFVGTVERSPDPRWTGRRVVGEINASCGTCERCLGGLERHCPNRSVLGIVGRDGAFAERIVLPLRNLHEVPESMPDEVAVFVEPVAAAYEILEQIEPPRDTSVVVIGGGRLGALCAGVLRAHGASTMVWGGHPEKRARLEKLGIPTIPTEETPDRAFDLAVDATGSTAGLRRALESVRPRGTVVLKSTFHGDATLALAGVVIDEITVVGSRCGPFAPAIAHLTDDASIVEGMITAAYPLDRVDVAFDHASRRDALKILLTP